MFHSFCYLFLLNWLKKEPSANRTEQIALPSAELCEDPRDKPNKPSVVPQDPGNSAGLFKAVSSGEQIPAAAFKSWGLKAFFVAEDAHWSICNALMCILKSKYNAASQELWRESQTCCWGWVNSERCFQAELSDSEFPFWKELWYFKRVFLLKRMNRTSSIFLSPQKKTNPNSKPQTNISNSNHHHQTNEPLKLGSLEMIHSGFADIFLVGFFFPRDFVGLFRGFFFGQLLHLKDSSLGFLLVNRTQGIPRI